jgi:hypothetical protein
VVEKRKCLFKFAPSIQVIQWFLWLRLCLSVIAWHPYCVISNSITTTIIHTTQHHYQSLTAPNDVTIPFAAKCSIIPFNCHTLDLSPPPLRFWHSGPLWFHGIWTTFPG